MNAGTKGRWDGSVDTGSASRPDDPRIAGAFAPGAEPLRRPSPDKPAVRGSMTLVGYTAVAISAAVVGAALMGLAWAVLG